MYKMWQLFTTRLVFRVADNSRISLPWQWWSFDAVGQTPFNGQITRKQQTRQSSRPRLKEPSQYKSRMRLQAFLPLPVRCWITIALRCVQNGGTGYRKNEICYKRGWNVRETHKQHHENTWQDLPFLLSLGKQLTGRVCFPLVGVFVR
jgi:hypothetical protein